MTSPGAHDDLESLRQNAVSLALAGRLGAARNAWLKIDASAADQGEAALQIVKLTIEKCRRGETASTTRGDDGQPSPTADEEGTLAGPPAPVVSKLAQVLPADGVKRTLVQQLEYAVREYPSNPEFYLQLAPLYLEKGRDYDAERLLAKGREDTENDPRVCALWEDVAMLRMTTKLELAQRDVVQHDSEQGRAALAQLHRDRDRLEIGIFTARCEREPESAAMHFELGRRLQRAEKREAARSHLHSALADSALRSPAAYELGRCYEQERQWAQALKYYRLAADSALKEQTDLRKTALQAATRLAIDRKLRAAAMRYLDQWQQCDPHDGAAAELRRAAREQLPPLPSNLLSADSAHDSSPDHRPASGLSAAGRTACRKPL
jgi:tetratricopeptide (TPR) repeat protein